MTYSNIQPPFTLKFHEMPKPEVKAYGAWFLESIPTRMAELAAAVQQTPGVEGWEPDLTVDSLHSLGEWFAGQVEMEPRTAEAIREIESNLTFPIDVPTEDLTIRSYSLAMDIGMYLGEVVRQNVSGAAWKQTLQLSRKNVNFGQMLLVWAATPVPMDPVRITVNVARGLANQTEDGGCLTEVYGVWTERKK